MTLRLFVALCTLVCVAAAAEENVIGAVACPPCKAYEFVFDQTLTISAAQAVVFYDTFELFCAGLPKALMEACASQATEYKTRVRDAEALLTSDSLCDAVYGCAREETFMDTAFENESRFGGRLCEICMAAAGTAEAALDVKGSVEIAAATLRELCHSYPIVDEATCLDYVQAAVDQVIVPTPRELCEVAELC